MKSKAGLVFDVEVSASGYSRGYYIIDKPALMELLEINIEADNIAPDEVEEYSIEFLKENARNHCMEFIEVRDDKDRETYVTLIK